jgi:hypothetical protein
MTVGTFFTLFVIPSIYMLIAKNKVKHEAVSEAVMESRAEFLKNA